MTSTHHSFSFIYLYHRIYLMWNQHAALYCRVKASLADGLNNLGISRPVIILDAPALNYIDAWHRQAAGGPSWLFSMAVDILMATAHSWYHIVVWACAISPYFVARCSLWKQWGCRHWLYNTRSMQTRRYVTPRLLEKLGRNIKSAKAS